MNFNHEYGKDRVGLSNCVYCNSPIENWEAVGAEKLLRRRYTSDECNFTAPTSCVEKLNMFTSQPWQPRRNCQITHYPFRPFSKVLLRNPRYTASHPTYAVWQLIKYANQILLILSRNSFEWCRFWCAAVFIYYLFLVLR